MEKKSFSFAGVITWKGSNFAKQTFLMALRNGLALTLLLQASNSGILQNENSGESYLNAILQGNIDFSPQAISFKNYQSYTSMGENSLLTAKANRKF